MPERPLHWGIGRTPRRNRHLVGQDERPATRRRLAIPHRKCPRKVEAPLPKNQDLRTHYAGGAWPPHPHPARTPAMPFEGCVVVPLEPGAWYVCVPPVCEGNEYSALTRPLKRAEAFKVCKELNTLEMPDWSELTRKALRQATPTRRV